MNIRCRTKNEVYFNKLEGEERRRREGEEETKAPTTVSLCRIQYFRRRLSSQGQIHRADHYTYGYCDRHAKYSSILDKLSEIIYGYEIL